MLFPIIVDLIYKEGMWLSFLIPSLSLFLISIPILIFLKPKDTMLYAREGFVITALAWVMISLIGALPFFVSGQIPRFIDAFFESVSGFTTTGASILQDVEILSHAMLFWRSFTHWIGGMGVLVFVLAFLPTQDGSNIHILRAESTGPNVGKLVSKMQFTARILYAIYLTLLLLQH